jgi:hypothetical protein
MRHERGGGLTAEGRSRPLIRRHRGDSLPPDGPFEGKRGRSRLTAMRQMPVIASLAATGLAHLLQVTRHGLKKTRYQPGLIEGCRTKPA